MMLEMQHVISSMDGVNPFTFAFVALLAGAFGRFIKTKSFGDFLNWLPPTWLKAIPKEHIKWYAIGFAIVTSFVYAKFSLHLGLEESVIMSVLGAVLGGGSAIGGHETLKKIVTPKPTTGGTDGDPGDPEKGPPGTLKIAFVASVLIVMVSTRIGWTSQSALAPTPAPHLIGCSLLTPKNITEAFLSVADIACLEEGEGSHFSDSEEAAAACKIAKNPLLRDVIRNLVSQRNAAKRVGFVWSPDGGHIEVTTKDAGQ
jgi:hypothetical protein